LLQSTILLLFCYYHVNASSVRVRSTSTAEHCASTRYDIPSKQFDCVYLPKSDTHYYHRPIQLVNMSMIITHAYFTSKIQSTASVIPIPATEWRRKCKRWNVWRHRHSVKHKYVTGPWTFCYLPFELCSIPFPFLLVRACSNLISS